MASERSSFVRELQPERFIERFVDLGKSRPINDKQTITTCFTPDPSGSFYHMALIWLYSLISVSEKLPRIIVLYDQGALPDIFRQFTCVEYVPVVWKLNRQEQKTQAHFNFCAKTQALLMSTSEYTIWSDVDLLFIKDVCQQLQKTTFVFKEDRVAGGFYCLKREDLSRYFSKLLFRLGESLESAGSDQKMMWKILQDLNIDVQYIKNNEDWFHHLDKKSVQSSEFRTSYLEAYKKLTEV